jgi:hypothetical protein
LFGAILVPTEHPGEHEDLEEDPAQKQEFVSRIQLIQAISEQFINNAKVRYGDRVAQYALNFGPQDTSTF